jgi:hypothetical protein
MMPACVLPLSILEEVRLKKIGKDHFTTAYEYIKSNCAHLYRSLFEYHFLTGDQGKVLANLKTYQNEDGGFGHGLEPDFLLPLSSPLATTIAFQILNDIQHFDNDTVQKAITYYDHTFDSTRKGWWSVPPEVNHYPHAPWWEYHNQDCGTVIDRSWGNPSSEIIGTLSSWNEYSTLNIEELLEYALHHLNNLPEFTSEHELYCYLRMYQQVPQHIQNQLKEKLAQGIRTLICLDERKWDTYVPKPFDFMQSKTHPLFDEIADYADMSCDYLINTMDKSVWHPSWRWNQYEAEWEKSEQNWTAVLTIKNYKILKEFDRLEGVRS